MAVALAAFTFTSCEDVPMPYDYPGTGGGSETPTIEAEGDGTMASPYNITALNDYASSLEAGQSSPDQKYFKGKVVSIKEAPGNSYGNATFYLSDDGTTKNQFYVYRCYGPGNKKFTASDEDMFTIGDEVLVCGTITNYNGTLETEQNKAYVVSVNGEGGTDNPGTSVDPKGAGTAADPFNVAAAIAKCTETGETATTETYYVQGVAQSIDASGAGQYGNITIDMTDEGGSEVFKAFQIVSFNGAKFTEASVSSTVKEGDLVVVKGNLVNYKNNTPETTGKGAAQLVSVNGVGGGDTPDTPDTPGDATEITCAKAVEICNALEDKVETTELYTVTGYITETDGKISRDQQVFWMADTKDGGKVFEAYWANIPDPTKALPVGTKLKMTGKLMRFGTTPEMKNGNVVVIEMGEGGTGNEGGNDNPGTGGASLADFTNGDFEQWDGSTPVNWKSACSASSATLAQSTDAHGGSYAVIVKGNSSQNKRLAYKELTLDAGTYEFSFYAKATSDNKAQVRPGYVPVTDGSVGNYAYGDYANLSTSWTKVTHEFTLAAKTTICLVVMNPKASNYSSGEDVLIDDASLVMKSSAKAKRIRK